MTDHPSDTSASTQAWIEQAAYHRDRAMQERSLAARSPSDAARSAHLMLSERHLQLAASAELVVGMADPASPQSSSLHHTGALMRESYGEPT